MRDRTQFDILSGEIQTLRKELDTIKAQLALFAPKRTKHKRGRGAAPRLTVLDVYDCIKGRELTSAPLICEQSGKRPNKMNIATAERVLIARGFRSTPDGAWSRRLR